MQKTALKQAALQYETWKNCVNVSFMHMNMDRIFNSSIFYQIAKPK